MPAVLSKEALVERLKAAARKHGMQCHPVDQEGLKAALETTSARWIFGGRTVTYHMGCRLEEATHTVRFREAVTEETWGIPAPFFWVERTAGPEGTLPAGPIEYLRIRRDVEETVRQAGWRFTFERGQRP
jgi:hypothetical protein